MKTRTLMYAAFAVAMIASQPASAGIVSVTPAIGGSPIWTNRLNFDDLLGDYGGAATTTTGPSGTATVVFEPNAKAVNGSVGGQYAAPFLSGSNGAGFGAGGANQAGGVDTTNYLTSGTSSNGVTIKNFGGVPGSVQKYFGLLWGSVDNYNSLTFYLAGQVVGTVVGSDVDQSPTGNQGVSGTYYVNINTTGYDEVRATSTQFAFELDNVSYSEQTVPDGGATLTLLGSVFVGLGVLRRRFNV